MSFFIVFSKCCIDEHISFDITSCPLLLFRYVEPQWQLLNTNNSVNISQLQTEECLDGWTFDRSEFLASTVSEVMRRNCFCSLIFIYKVNQVTTVNSTSLRNLWCPLRRLCCYAVFILHLLGVCGTLSGGCNDPLGGCSDVCLSLSLSGIWCVLYVLLNR